MCVSGTCVDVVQVALMGLVSSAVAAMDAHRGVAAVAEHGLCFLRCLSIADANRVCARCLRSVDCRQGGGQCVCGRVWNGRVCAKAGGLRA